MASGEFTSVAEYEIDDDLTLLLARGEGTPRLGIYNTNSDKKKFVPLSWVEDAGRSLKIKVGRSTKEYSMDAVLEGVGSLIASSSDALALNALAWRGVQLMGDLIHMPKTARSDADLSLIADNKRNTLWYIYTPKKGKWRVLPCFATTESEKKIMETYLEEGRPWPVPALSIENGQLPFTMRNIPFAKEICIATPRRWSEFMLPLSKAMLLGFSDWSSGGEHNFGDALWKYLPTSGYRSEDTVTAIAKAGQSFMNKIIAYLRLWPVLENVQIEHVPDVSKTGEERGLKKRERFEMVAPNLGDKRFRVTRFVDDGGTVAFGIVPETRLPGEQDRMVTLTEHDWETSLDACALGGERDPQFTCNSVLGGIETRDWYNRILHCISGQSQDKGDE